MGKPFSFFGYMGEWVGGREENGCSPVFFLTAYLPPTLYSQFITVGKML